MRVSYASRQRGILLAGARYLGALMVVIAVAVTLPKHAQSDTIQLGANDTNTAVDSGFPLPADGVFDSLESDPILMRVAQEVFPSPGDTRMAMMNFLVAPLAGMTINTATVDLDVVSSSSSVPFTVEVITFVSDAALTLLNANSFLFEPASTTFVSLGFGLPGSVTFDVTSDLQPLADNGDSYLGIILKGPLTPSDNIFETYSGFASSSPPRLFVDFTAPQVIPVPAALPLLATALVGVCLLGWRRRKAA